MPFIGARRPDETSYIILLLLNAHDSITATEIIVFTKRFPDKRAGRRARRKTRDSFSREI